MAEFRDTAPLIQYYNREYNLGEQKYLSLESVSIVTGQDDKKNLKQFSISWMVKHSCASNWVHDFGQFHFMIQGSNKIPLKKKQKKKSPKCQEVFSIMLLESSKSSWKTIFITLQHTSKTEQKKVTQEEWKKIRG